MKSCVQEVQSLAKCHNNPWMNQALLSLKILFLKIVSKVERRGIHTDVVSSIDSEHSLNTRGLSNRSGSGSSYWSGSRSGSAGVSVKAVGDSVTDERRQLSNNPGDQIVVVGRSGSRSRSGSGSGARSRTRSGPGSGNRSGSAGSGSLASDFNEIFLEVALFSVAVRAGLVGDGHQRAVCVDVAILTRDLLTVAVLVMGNIGLCIVVGDLVGVCILRIGVHRSQIVFNLGVKIIKCLGLCHSGTSEKAQQKDL